MQEQDGTIAAVLDGIGVRPKNKFRQEGALGMGP